MPARRRLAEKNGVVEDGVAEDGVAESQRTESQRTCSIAQYSVSGKGVSGGKGRSPSLAGEHGGKGRSPSRRGGDRARGLSALPPASRRRFKGRSPRARQRGRGKGRCPSHSGGKGRSPSRAVRHRQGAEPEPLLTGGDRKRIALPFWNSWGQILEHQRRGPEFITLAVARLWVNQMTSIRLVFIPQPSLAFP